MHLFLVSLTIKMQTHILVGKFRLLAVHASHTLPHAVAPILCGFFGPRLLSLHCGWWCWCDGSDVLK